MRGQDVTGIFDIANLTIFVAAGGAFNSAVQDLNDMSASQFFLTIDMMVIAGTGVQGFAIPQESDDGVTGWTIIPDITFDVCTNANQVFQTKVYSKIGLKRFFRVAHIVTGSGQLVTFNEAVIRGNMTLPPNFADGT